jgi:hypothetical protein
MIAEHMRFITAALAHVQIPENFVKQEQRAPEEYPKSIAAYLFFKGASLKRDGSKIRYDGMPTGQTVRQWFKGSGMIRLELFMRSQEQLEDALIGILEYIHQNALYNAQGVPLEFPAGEIKLSFEDEEGIMLSRTGFALEFPIQIGVFDNTTWQPISIDVTDSLELVQEV